MGLEKNHGYLSIPLAGIFISSQQVNLKTEGKSA